MGKFRSQLKSEANKAKKVAERARKELDRKLLGMTKTNIDKIKKKIAERKDKLPVDSEIVGEMAAKILSKAQEIRESIEGQPIVEKAKERSKKTLGKVRKKKFETPAPPPEVESVEVEVETEEITLVPTGEDQ